MNFKIHTAISAIHIVEQSWRQQCVIKSTVENFLVVCTLGLDGNSPEFAFPGISGGLTNGIEIPAG